MDKKNSADFFKPIKKLFKRFHLTLFFVFIIACLVGAVLLINGILKEPVDPNYTSPISAGSIDKATLSRLNSLHTSSQGTPAPELPAGRINPFNE